MKGGKIETWEKIQKVMNHTFKELKVDPQEVHGVVLTEEPLVNIASR